MTDSDRSSDDPPHDVLAADEFSVPGSDPSLAHGPVDVPDAPFSAGDPPHDVLAAEEFAVPAGRPGPHDPASSPTRRRVGRLVAASALVGAIVTVVSRRRS